MKGAAAKAASEAEADMAHAYNTVALYTEARSKRGLKPLRHYLKKPPRRMSDAEMLGNMKILAARANRAAGGQ